MRILEFKIEIGVSIYINDDDLTNDDIIETINSATYLSDLTHLGEPVLDENNIESCNMVQNCDILLRNE